MERELTPRNLDIVADWLSCLDRVVLRYKAALQRLDEHPDEFDTWVFSVVGEPAATEMQDDIREWAERLRHE